MASPLISSPKFSTLISAFLLFICITVDMALSQSKGRRQGQVSRISTEFNEDENFTLWEERGYSDDDNSVIEYLGISDFDYDQVPTSQLKHCSQCTSHNPDCEHGPRTGHTFQNFDFPPSVEHDFRKFRVFWDGKWCIENDTKAFFNFKNFMGAVTNGKSCDPIPNGKLMCKNFEFNSIHEGMQCYSSTNLACKSGTKTCEEASLSPVWNGTLHFDIGNGCLNQDGQDYFNDKILPTFSNNKDGKRLHRESCEPFNDESEDKRCSTLSINAIDYSDKSKQRKTCLKPTRLKCDPIIKKCICGDDEMPEIQYQYGNKSNICFVRPTMTWAPGYTCGGRSKASPFYHMGSVCQCKSIKFLRLFNQQCHQWWVCNGVHISPNMYVIILLAFLLIFQN